jgi:hypothetical protein
VAVAGLGRCVAATTLSLSLALPLAAALGLAVVLVARRAERAAVSAEDAAVRRVAVRRASPRQIRNFPDQSDE